MDDIIRVLGKLATQRPAFHSEADFQHAFAWELHRSWPSASVRLELPLQVSRRSVHSDVWAVQGKAAVAIELKYKTRAWSGRIGDESFVLKNQSAQDIGRYDFVKDVYRLEQLVSTREGIEGYAILLTNDSSYWTKRRDHSPVDVAFRLEEGRVLSGTLSWDQRASSGTTKNRESPLDLIGEYSVRWHGYSEPSSDRYAAFRYLAIKVARPLRVSAAAK